MKKNKKKKLTVVALFAMLAIVSATFAWWTASKNVENEFSTKRITDDSLHINEIFKKPENWQPGEKIVKEVSIQNLGDSPFIVRVNFREVLDQLKADGTDATKPAMKDATIAELASIDPKWVAKEVPTALYSTWNTVAVGDLDPSGVAALDNGLTVKYKEVADATDATKTIRTYVAYRDLGNGKAQKVNVPTDGIKTVAGKVYIDPAITFAFYAEKEHKELDWANPTAGTPSYTVSPKFVDVFDVKADALTGTFVNDHGKLMKIEFNNDAVTRNSTTPEANKWFYNEKDGYFYYIGQIQAGGESPQLIKSVTLLDSAKEVYSLMDAILDIHATGLQAEEAAIKATDAGGWAFGETPAGDKALIFDAMKAAGAFSK
ncbi:BsaA family SipW-dependent biofilm matrix protein [Isobaculum melis]|uniref:Alternate signal-mediated exported protein, CPF_0494 family n=1 Tax=Isobaculum melis TaxID=142588 RepID=A0A1H9RJ51_9LACT|nr:BsaA family SipW-dependent biofilm matrix protein [Isobaculum melis]SER72820.1 alternate signal-mediated exported protein, CPF_0494 family [Isobaculum melis]